MRLVIAIPVLMRTISKAVVAIALIAVIPPAIVAFRGGHDFTGALSAASLIAGAGAGYGMDDPAAPTLAPSPTPLITRRLLREMIVMVTMLAAWFVAQLIANLSGPAGQSAGALLREFAASAAVACAVASFARNDTAVSPGASATGAALMTVLTISAMAYRWPALPTLGDGPTSQRWWIVVGAGLVASAWASRDPAARCGRIFK